jgi:head-tail adaptor
MAGLSHLNRPLTLQQSRSVPDGAGGLSEVWDDLGVLWAMVTARSGSGRPGEFRSAGRLGLKISVRFAHQGSPARPEPGQRFKDGARVYLIEAVHEADDAQRLLVCFAEEELDL